MQSCYAAATVKLRSVIILAYTFVIMNLTCYIATYIHTNRLMQLMAIFRLRNTLSLSLDLKKNK